MSEDTTKKVTDSMRDVGVIIFESYHDSADIYELVERIYLEMERERLGESKLT